MRCEIPSELIDNKFVLCGRKARVKVIFLDDTVKAVCPRCFYEQIVNGSGIGFFTDDHRVDFTYKPVT